MRRHRHNKGADGVVQAAVGEVLDEARFGAVEFVRVAAADDGAEGGGHHQVQAESSGKLVVESCAILEPPPRQGVCRAQDPGRETHRAKVNPHLDRGRAEAETSAPKASEANGDPNTARGVPAKSKRVYARGEGWRA